MTTGRFGILGLVSAALVAALLLVACVLCNHRPYRPNSISWAAMTGDLELLKQLEARGTNLDIQDPHAFNWTPLMAAIFHGNTNIIQYLLTRNVNVNLQDREGRTALMWAITTEDTNTVRLLLERGANIMIKDKTGGDAFVVAKGSPDRAALLEWLNRYKPETNK